MSDSEHVQQPDEETTEERIDDLEPDAKETADAKGGHQPVSQASGKTLSGSIGGN
jgi:hypothetical protein